MIERQYTLFQTQLGWVGILASDKGLLAVTLPHPTQAAARKELGSGIAQDKPATGVLSDLTERLKAYFGGKKTVFPDKLVFSRATPFQKLVWQAARQIPYGEMRSYLWLAKEIGKPGAARAVGQALGKNPFLIIVPCHRIIASDGGLGGFGGGLEMKRRLLRLEGSNIM